MNASPLIIRPMTPADLPAVITLEKEIFSDPWPRSGFVELLSRSTTTNLVVTDDQGEVLGYLCAEVTAEELHIYNVAVDPAYRKQGLGRCLMERVEMQSRENGAICAALEVRINNTAALAMYGRLGYRRIGRQRRFYRRPVCDALVLFKTFDDSCRENPEHERCADGMVS